MNVVMADDGSYVVTLSRAEAHVIVWGGPTKTVEAIETDLRHKIVEIEDNLTEAEYAKLVDEVDELPTIPSLLGLQPREIT